MRPRIILLIAGWLAGAAAAATGVTLALSALGSGLFGAAGQTLSAAQVEQQLAQAGPEPPAAAAGSPQATSQGGTPGVKNTSGGGVVVRCTSQGALLAGATPWQGYRVDDLVRGPARVVAVSFRSDSAEVHVAASCPTGQPLFAVSNESRGGHGDDNLPPAGPTSQSTVPASPGGDHHGGGNGGGGNDHGGGGSGGSPGGSGGTSGGSGGTSGGSGGTSGGSGGGGSDG
jgi:hypothetical protein